MSARTSIEWCDVTWNPVRGCSRVSEGCRNCYAETYAARNLPGMRSPTTGEPFAVRTKGGPRWTGKVELIPKALDEPLRWRKPLKVFVNSMSDLFHEALPFAHIERVYNAMAACPQHTFQVLTKRPQRRLQFVEWIRESARRAGIEAVGWPLHNVWEGTSVEDQATADERIPMLLQTPAAVRFVSYEPALAGVDFGEWLFRCDGDCARPNEPHGEPILDWLIVGGESGPGATSSLRCRDTRREGDARWGR